MCISPVPAKAPEKRTATPANLRVESWALEPEKDSAATDAIVELTTTGSCLIGAKAAVNDGESICTAMAQNIGIWKDPVRMVAREPERDARDGG